MTKLFVWDLHGVLEQGNDRTTVDVSNEVLAQSGEQRRFTYEDGVRLNGLRWYEYFEDLLPERTHEEHLELQDACFKLSEEQPELQYRWVTRTPYVTEVLSAIQERHWQILISNTRPATLDIFLKLLDVENFFPAGSAFAVDQHVRHARTTKRNVLAQFLASAGPYDDIVIIGDSPDDMRLVEVAGGTTYLFSHSYLSFRECHSDYRIRDLRELLVAI